MVLHHPLAPESSHLALQTSVSTMESIPDWLFPLSTAMALFGLGLCFWHASTREEYGFILAGVGWGYVLEQASIAGYETYSYNVDEFVLTLLDVPLDIAFTWGAILYAGWQTGKYLGLSTNRLPVFVGLFALHIDLALDVVAIRVPFWTWGVEGAWYGIPLHNFWGWWTVAFLFVGSFLALRRWIDRVELRLLLTVPCALVLFIASITAYGTLVGGSTAAETALLVLIGVGSLAAVLTDDVAPRHVPLRIAVVPFNVHLFFLGLGLWIGTFQEHPVLLAVALAMLALSGVLHAVPYLSRRRGAGPARA